MPWRPRFGRQSEAPADRVRRRMLWFAMSPGAASGRCIPDRPAVIARSKGQEPDRRDRRSGP